jgi:hypothetical protein
MSRAIASRGRIRRSGLLSVAWLWLSLCGVCGLARAESAQRSLGFSRLIERTERDTPMRFGQDSYRVSMLKQLRSAGLRAVGGEDSLFGPDQSGAAELLLGGAVTEYRCQRFQSTINCRIGVHWQVFDIRSNRLLYELMARGAIYGVREQETVVSVGEQLLRKALASLLSRPQFKALLTKDAASPELTAESEPETLRDRADAVPSLDPEGDARRTEATRRAEAVAAEVTTEAARRTAAFDLKQRRLAEEEHTSEELARRTPAYVSAMKWGGLALGSFGLIAVAVSQSSYDRATTSKKDFETLRLWNDLGWVSVAVGGGSFAASLLLAPRAPIPKSASGMARAQLPSPLLLGVQGRY